MGKESVELHCENKGTISSVAEKMRIGGMEFEKGQTRRVKQKTQFSFTVLQEI